MFICLFSCRPTGDVCRCVRPVNGNGLRAHFRSAAEMPDSSAPEEARGFPQQAHLSPWRSVRLGFMSEYILAFFFSFSQNPSEGAARLTPGELLTCRTRIGYLPTKKNNLTVQGLAALANLGLAVNNSCICFTLQFKTLLSAALPLFLYCLVGCKTCYIE